MIPRKLVQSIQRKIQNTANIPVYYRRAPATAAPPFCVFLLTMVRKEDDIQQYELLADICDYARNEDHALELSEKMGMEMDYFCYLDDGQSWESYTEHCEEIDSSDKQVQRVRTRMEIRYMDRRNK